MASYRVRVRTGTQPGAGTADSISITLVGTRGCSPKTPLDGWGPDFCCGGEREYVVQSPRALGALLLLRVHKEPYGRLPQSSWFLESVRVWPVGGGTRGTPLGTATTPLGTAMTPLGTAMTLLGTATAAAMAMRRMRSWKRRRRRRRRMGMMRMMMVVVVGMKVKAMMGT